MKWSFSRMVTRIIISHLIFLLLNEIHEGKIEK